MLTKKINEKIRTPKKCGEYKLHLFCQNARAFDNGTLHPEKRLHYDKDNHSLKPYDLKVDWNTRLLFWTCEHTNSINVPRLD